MMETHENVRLNRLLADAILGIDTLWGGDVMNPSGAGRFVADSWFSDEPLPPAYSHPSATRLRETSGISAGPSVREAVREFLAAVDVHGAIRGVGEEARSCGRRRRAYLDGVALCLEIMWRLALEVLGEGDPVSYADCVKASTGREPEPSNPAGSRTRLAGLLEKAGYPTGSDGGLLTAADSWRLDRMVPGKSIPALGAAFVAHFDDLSKRNLVPFLPATLQQVPRANIRFTAIRDAWFSGSMNYLGRARRADGTPEYEATYEINSSLEISVPEFMHLVSHEVVPGHVTTFALIQNQYVRGKVGFEASVLTMNTRGATLFEGIANNAILMAHGVTEIEQLPDEDLQIGVLLALLQDEAKNQASYLTWQEGWAQPDVAALLRRDYLVSEERAGKLSGTWGRHPLLGRMYLPAYRAGTELVASLRRSHPAEKVIPVLYGCRGLVDAVTVKNAL
jgi:hypothetical protein